MEGGLNCESVKNQIVGWLKDYAVKSGLDGFVVGVSGGVDSALVSTLCAETGLSTLVVEMPIHRPVSNIVERSAAHVEWLKSKYKNVNSNMMNLSSVYDAAEDVFFLGFGVTMTDLAKANTRSRLRMVALYSIANTFNLLVAGTGNKVEDFGVAFFTKYGDGGVDISPIGNLLKPQVRELAAYLGVIKDIVDAVPTDELWADTRSDEAQIGASYDELEWAMKYCQDRKWERNLDVPDMKALAITPPFLRQMHVVSIYLKRHEQGAHKMQMPPICPISWEEYK